MNMSRNIVKRKNGKIVLYTILTFVILSALFLSLADYLYISTEAQAKETLHVQTKQIKDDLTLQILSDRENLATMANFAAKLYLDGEDYSLLFESFKPIGLIANIGILKPDNTFVTKTGSINLSGQISFSDEAAQGTYISGRVKDLTHADNELVRSSVPIIANGKPVGILYGVLKLQSFEERYHSLAAELDAQLFVYDRETGDLIIDSIHDELGNISFLHDRTFNRGYSYEEFAASENGYTSFQSAYRDENVLMHYSIIEEFGWKIALVRYDSQVYAETHTLLNILLCVFAAMVAVMSIFSIMLMMVERRKNRVIDCASNIRKILIETSGNNNNINDALKEVVSFTKSRSALFFNTNDEDFHSIAPEVRKMILPVPQRNTLKAELFRYVSGFTTNENASLTVISLRQDKHLEKSNPSFYAMLKEYHITELIFSATVNHSNHITILCVINPKHRADASYLAEKVAACFTIALNNHNILNKTKLAATTDSLTGTLNRVAYSSDLHKINEEQPLNFSCVYFDVNELHWRNNKFGHSAGDEMLLYIAHTLKDVFFGQKVYRMGGDEYLVFCQGLSHDEVLKGIDIFLEQLKPRGYHVAVGMSFRSQNTNTEEMVKEAEVRMFENKAKFYQNKEQQTKSSAENEYIQAKTGILEIDTMLSVLKESYNGIYRVSLDTDSARRILMPTYLKYNETEEHFSKLFAKYVSESAQSDYNRALLTFQNYDALKQQLAEGKIPRITYKKINGETVTLSVYSLDSSKESVSETLWIFAKK